MPILVRFTNFCDFHDFQKAVATAFLRISKIPTVNFEINSLFVQKFLFSTNTNLCPKNLNLRLKVKDFSAVLCNQFKGCAHNECKLLFFLHLKLTWFCQTLLQR